MNLVENQILSLGMSEKPENILWSYDHVPFARRTSASQIFRRSLAPVSRSIGTFKEEAIQAAQKIGQLNKGPITILASGGSDSEVVMRSFLMAKVPFQIVAINFSSVNEDELKYLQRFCDLEGLKYRTVHLDIEKFWENELAEVALTSGSASPQVCAILHVMKQLDEYLIVGDGDVDLFEQSGRFYDTWGEKWAYAQWMLAEQKAGCPSFFSYTSELEAAMYLDPIVEDWIDGGWDYIGQCRFQYVKPLFYYHHFGVRHRPKIDIFKPIKDLDDQWRKSLLSKMPGANSYHSIEYSLIRKLKQGHVDVETVEVDREQLPTEEQGRFSSGMESGRHRILRQKQGSSL